MQLKPDLTDGPTFVKNVEGSNFQMASYDWLADYPDAEDFYQLLVMHVAIVVSSLVLVGAIKGEVILTYLGLGVQDGASWGLLIAGASQDLANDIWAPLLGTVTAMFLLIYSLSVVADALRDALDPKLR